MVGVARIELATPAMSTRAASANVLIFLVSGNSAKQIWPMKMGFNNGSGSH
jgi:hypothetical protein